MINEDSDSEEEILVYAEFEDSVHIDKYRAIHILGVDEKNPIIQLDETFFTGKYENALGTYMFFEHDPTLQGKDTLFDKYPDKGVKYVHKTRKLVSMEHAYVTPKEGKDQTTQSHVKQKGEDVLPVTFKDLPQAIDTFKTYFLKGPAESASYKNPDQKSSRNINTTESTIDQIRNKIEKEFKTSQNPGNISTKTINEQCSENIEVDITADQYPNDIEMEPVYEPNFVKVVTESAKS